MNDSTSDPQDMSQETESSDVAVPAKKAVARKNTRKKSGANGWRRWGCGA